MNPEIRYTPSVQAAVRELKSKTDMLVFCYSIGGIGMGMILSAAYIMYILEALA